MGMKKEEVSIMSITPRVAGEWIDRSHPRQRRLRNNRVKQYAADMKDGKWPVSTQVIAFDTAGLLVNGRHTLSAIELSGVTVRCIVLRNIQPSALLVMDCGLKRTTQDHFELAGRNWVSGCAGTVRRIIAGMKQSTIRGISDIDIDRFMTKYGDSVEIAHKLFNVTWLGNSSIRAVIARAHIRRVSEENLKRFSQVLNTGIMAAGEDAAVLLRNYIMSNRGIASASRPWRLELYAMTESALSAFVRGERLPKLIATKVELYVLPRESELI